MNKAYKNIIEFTLHYNQYKKKLYNYVFKMVNEKFVCEDIVQNVFMKFYENIEKIKRKQSIQAWLFITARNEIYNYWRRKKIKRENYLIEDYETPSPGNLEIDYEKKEIKEIIEQELKTFSDEHKEIFILREYSGFSYREISTILNIDEEIVKSRLFRTRQRLIKKLRKLV